MKLFAVTKFIGGPNLPRPCFSGAQSATPLIFTGPNLPGPNVPGPNLLGPKYRYTNTHIQHMTKCQKDPTCSIFLKRGLFKDIKNNMSKSQTYKYKNTNTQIPQMVRCQKDPLCGIFLKRGLFNGIKNDIRMSQIRKYKNTNLRYTNTGIQDIL